jgi:hypothetical protein
MARLPLLLAAAAIAAALLLGAPPAAAQPARETFFASLAPLPNTTGVRLGGAGDARISFDASSNSATRGNNVLTLTNIRDLVRTAQGAGLLPRAPGC